MAAHAVNMSSLELPAPSERPTHVAVIMDGNGRWATQRDLPRLEGHRRGADVVREITTFSRELEIPYLTLYSFSVQNWRRPPDEVAGLFQLLEEYCEDERDTLMDNNIRLAIIGDLSRLPSSTRDAVLRLMEETANNTMMTLTLAVDYGAREEMILAARRLAEAVRDGTLDSESIDEAKISSYLYTRNMPDPDLLVRTSGELRLSNFLLWQAAYAELYFTEVHWPDFTRSDFAAALRAYAGRHRRFGGVDSLCDKKAPPC